MVTEVHEAFLDKRTPICREHIQGHISRRYGNRSNERAREHIPWLHILPRLEKMVVCKQASENKNRDFIYSYWWAMDGFKNRVLQSSHFLAFDLHYDRDLDHRIPLV